MTTDALRPGIYNQEYFSGSQVGIYIGDVWVDEITSFQFSVGQNKTPLYGYADSHFRDVSRGRVLVQGQFSINFKEAGYLYLILDRYRQVMKGKTSKMWTRTHEGQGYTGNLLSPKDVQQSLENQRNIERVVNGELNAFDTNAIFAGLGGYSSNARAEGRFTVPETDNDPNFVGPPNPNPSAESVFEAFEDMIWGKSDDELISDRRSDDHLLNPFDIYIGYGDFTGDDSLNHTVQKITDVHILHSEKGFAADGRPIQEIYQFIGRNVV